MSQTSPMADTLETSHDRRRSALAERLNILSAEIIERTSGAVSEFALHDADSRCSRDNLLAYLALRDHDLQDLQLELAEIGLSSLGRLESNVLTSLQRVMEHVGGTFPPTSLALPDSAKAQSLLAQRSRALLGRPRAGRSTRIMVTLDGAVIRQSHLLEQLLLAGMDIARINCAHDSLADWAQIIDAIRQAENRLTHRGQGVGRRCRILMDLAGPKVRTGPLEVENRPLKLSVPKDSEGRPARLLEGYLDGDVQQSEWVRTPGLVPHFVIALQGQKSLAELRVGETLRFEDARQRARTLYVLERLSPSRVRVGLDGTAYLHEGATIRGEHGVELSVGRLTPQSVDLRVQAGDALRLYRNAERPGHRQRQGEPASISCTLPEALRAVEEGHRIYIDDGKISATVVSVHEQYLELEVTAPRGIPARIRPDKGLNLPDSTVDLPALTVRDREDLVFVVKHANAVGLSFVHRPQDLFDLRDALKELGKSDLGIVLKIETREAVHRLAQLLLAGLDLPRCGVMIARGDLAVEVGFERLAMVQEDILCLCEAAHVPVIWATQVLETLAKKGLPARAEITDAAMGQRAECVMLNKGEHVLEAVKTLAALLRTAERHHLKKRDVFREITEQRGVFGDRSTTAIRQTKEHCASQA
jgi:pyruvate kinase